MRIIIAAIVGGIIVFVWSAIAHIATPLGTMGITSMPDDPRITQGLAALPSSGMYFFPGMDMSHRPTAEEQKAFTDKVKAGPSGLLIITKGNGATMSGATLGSEFASNVVAALIAAILVSFMIGGWLKRAFAVALIGAFGIVSLLVSYWIWYGFPGAYVGGEAITEIVGWLLAGLAIAKIVRPPFVAIAPQ
jgi:hypothetical protein